MADHDIQIVDVRSLNETHFEIVDITGYDSKELLASMALKRSYSKRLVFAKPALTFTALISLAFKNSQFRRLTVQQVYTFIKRYFPYYVTADKGWKSSVRHTLCMSPYFMRWMPCRNPTSPDTRARTEKGLTWAVNPAMMIKVEELIARQLPLAQNSARNCTYREADMKLLLAGRIAETENDSSEEPAETENDSSEEPAETENDSSEEPAETENDSSEEPAETEEPAAPAEVPQPKPLIFTQYKDGLLPLVTLYAETPSDYEGYADRYPVKF